MVPDLPDAEADPRAAFGRAALQGSADLRHRLRQPEGSAEALDVRMQSTLIAFKGVGRGRALGRRDPAGMDRGPAREGICDAANRRSLPVPFRQGRHSAVRPRFRAAGADGETAVDRVPLLARRDPDAIVAIPVRNEEDRIAACLRADRRPGRPRAGSLGLVLFLNNCTDRTEAIVSELVPALSIPVRVLTENFSGAHAGWARRRAMDAAAAWLGDRGGMRGSSSPQTPTAACRRTGSSATAPRSGRVRTPLPAGSNSMPPRRRCCRRRCPPAAAWRTSTMP